MLCHTRLKFFILPFTFQGRTCVETLCKYLDNILLNPTEEKFRKIRKSNKAYQERVANTEGHDHFLEAAGFETATIDDAEFETFAEMLDRQG